MPRKRLPSKATRTRWPSALCCSEIQDLPHPPKYVNALASIASVEQLDFLLKQGGATPWEKDEVAIVQYLLKEDHYREGIISVLRMGDPRDEHWPVKFYAAYPEKPEEKLVGFIEIEKKKFDLGVKQGIFEDPNLPKYDRFYGNCPKHPNLEFYARFHPLHPPKEKPMFPWEKDPKEKEKKYPWDGHKVPEPSKEPLEVWGDIDFDNDNCPYPATMICENPRRRAEAVETEDDSDNWITKIDFDEWPQCEGLNCQ